MKRFFFLMIAFAAIAATGCKKNYDCKAVDEAGNETILTCESCSKNDVSDYEQAILDKGYVTADCAKK